MYRKDGQGNIVALIDSNGNVVVEYKYDAWGNHAVLNASGGDIEEGTHLDLWRKCRSCKSRSLLWYANEIYSLQKTLKVLIAEFAFYANSAIFIRNREYSPPLGVFLYSKKSTTFCLLRFGKIKENTGEILMNKKEIYHLLKRYHYIIEAIGNGETEAEIFISGRKENIQIDEKIITFVDIVQLIYKNEDNELIKSFIDKNVIHGQTNTRVFADKPLDKSTYYDYKSKFVDIIYHCCISKGLVTREEILEERIS